MNWKQTTLGEISSNIQTGLLVLSFINPTTLKTVYRL